MGVSAGRVLLIPKGDWNAETTYTCLDWVRHNGSSWVCKNTCTNIEPTEANSDNWQIMARDGTEITVDTAMSDDSENVVQNKVIKKYVDEHTPEVADMTGATATQNGAHGLVPAPQMGDEKKALLGDGTWGSVDAILTYKTKEEYDAAVANDEIPDGAKVIKEYDEEGSTAIFDVDTEMSDTSKNPVQNKVIKAYIDNNTTEINNVIQSLSEAIDAKKVPRTLIENIMTMDGGLVLDTGGDGAMLTPKTTWEPDNGGYRISINKCTAGALLVFNVPVNVPPKSVVYILVTTLNKEAIKIQGASNLMENTTDGVTKGQVNLNVQLPTGWTSTIINFMPIVFQNV